MSGGLIERQGILPTMPYRPYKYDLGDARVEAFAIARESGMNMDDFNRLWRCFIRGYKNQRPKDEGKV